jgi:hypothetical protein
MNLELSESDTGRAWELADRLLQAVIRGDVPQDLQDNDYFRLLEIANMGFRFEGEVQLEDAPWDPFANEASA